MLIGSCRQVVEYLGWIAFYEKRQEKNEGPIGTDMLPAEMRQWVQESGDSVQSAMKAKWYLLHDSRDYTVSIPDTGPEKFQQLIIETGNFEILFLRMRTALNFQWEESAIMQDISSKILENVISRKRRAGDTGEKCCVRFRMPARGLHSHLQAFEYDAQSESGSKHLSLGDIFTIALSGDEAQGTTVSNYFRQTWPGRDLLIQAIDEQIRNKLSVKSFHKYSGFELRTSVEDNHLIIEVSGDIATVVEYGEKSCWLASILCLGPTNGVIISEPSLHALKDYSTSWDIVQELCIEFEIKTKTSSLPRKPNYSDSWLKGLRKSVPLTIVRGFPVSRRPERCPGLELHSSALLRIPQNESGDHAIVRDCAFLLRPDWSYLELLGQMDGWFLWHHAHRTNTERLCQTKSLYAERLEKPSSTLADLKKHRHLICGCQLVNQG